MSNRLLSSGDSANIIMQSRTILCWLVFCLTTCVAFKISEYKIPSESVKYENWLRNKREVEDLSEEYNIDVKADEPGFWDRIVQVALRLFGTFVKWLNSS